MLQHQRILGVIPARGGSKGVPRKNVRVLCGKPLIAYTIEVALAAQHLFHRVIVSTDDQETAEIARHYGADVPFLRPPELAADDVPTVPVLRHAVTFVETQDNLRFDWICLLQPTEPLRTVQDLEQGIGLAAEGGCDSVISVTQVFATHPILMKKIERGALVPYCIEEKEGTRRQDYSPPAYMRNGAIYLTRRDVLMDQQSIWGDVIKPYVMPWERSVSVDAELDLRILEALMLDTLTARPCRI